MHAAVLTVLVLTLCVVHVEAYIPAVPSNNTNAVNQTDMSMLTMKWAPAGTYSNTVSFQLAKSNTTGFEQGALVHFSERNLTNQNTTTPWIALVNCDANTTDASQEIDIFTSARDRGAVAALLFSLTSEACLINPEYADPDNGFEQILDIFATQSKSSAQIINSQFSNLRNASFGTFDPQQLNQSADSVAASMQTSNITSAFIVATLRAANSTISPNGTDTGDNSPNDTSSSGKGNPNTGLAMIILYAITGCVSALFIIVILSGAIRAIRHPERYGPRAGILHGNATRGNAQSRTGGIGRAILDTFPIIKFGQGGTVATTEPKSSDVESQARPIEMTVRSGSEERKEEEQVHEDNPPTDQADTKESQTQVAEASSASGTQAVESTSASSRRTSSAAAEGTPEPATNPTGEEVRPGAIGHETCPICIVDFEAGDDLRVLPCEGKHKFHQTCVDPWLLELSSSCPLCREDFHALESMLAGNEAEEAEESAALAPDAPVATIAGTRSSRFSRYLKFARRRNRASQAGSPSGAEQSDAPSSRPPVT